MLNPLGYLKTCIILAMFPALCFAAPDMHPGRWEITYHGDSFKGTVVTNDSQMPSAMTQKMTGKRIGPCN